MNIFHLLGAFALAGVALLALGFGFALYVEYTARWLLVPLIHHYQLGAISIALSLLVVAALPFFVLALLRRMASPASAAPLPAAKDKTIMSWNEFRQANADRYLAPIDLSKAYRAYREALCPKLVYAVHRHPDLVTLLFPGGEDIDLERGLTWNTFQSAVAGRGLERGEVSKAWAAYKQAVAALPGPAPAPAPAPALPKEPRRQDTPTLAPAPAPTPRIRFTLPDKKPIQLPDGLTWNTFRTAVSDLRLSRDGLSRAWADYKAARATASTAPVDPPSPTAVVTLHGDDCDLRKLSKRQLLLLLGAASAELASREL